jgi:UDP-N-acetylmuramyl pentapeptide synthase
VELPGGAWLLRDDYKSSLETVDAALDTLEEIEAPAKIVVMGEISEPPGSQGPIYRRIGERIAGCASTLVLVGRNYQRYAAGARRGGMAKDAVIDAGTDLRAAAEAVAARLEPGCVVLIKGRDTQRLERIAFRLQGETVRCQLDACDARGRCDICPVLATGWRGLRAVV